MTTQDENGYVEPVGQGWLFFAGTILGLAGIMRIIDGIWALGTSKSLPDRLQDGLLGDNLHNYGWLWIAVGVLLILASFGVIARSQLSRWIGGIGAAIAAITAMVWMPYYPVWSLVYVAIAVMVIYALARYGSRDLA
jgi:hypothetical protein